MRKMTKSKTTRDTHGPSLPNLNHVGLGSSEGGREREFILDCKDLLKTNSLFEAAVYYPIKEKVT